MAAWVPGVGAEAPSFEELPDLPTLTPWLLIALVLVFWLTMRIRILHRRQARRATDEPPVQAWGWLGVLAASPWILPALAVVALLLAAGVAATFLLRG